MKQRYRYTTEAKSRHVLQGILLRNDWRTGSDQRWNADEKFWCEQYFDRGAGTLKTKVKLCLKPDLSRALAKQDKSKPWWVMHDMGKQNRGNEVTDVIKEAMITCEAHQVATRYHAVFVLFT